MTRTELTIAGLVAVALLAIVPAYDRVFLSTAWRGPALLAAMLALAIAVVIRRTGRGSLLVTVTTGVALLSLIPWLLGLAAGPVVPGRETVTLLRELLTTGVAQLRETPAPAEPLTGLMLLVVGGWWLVAHLAHELSVRWHRPAAGLVVLTVLWAAPLAIPMDGPAWPQALPFLVAAALLLMVPTGAGEQSRGATEPRPSLAGMAVGVVAVLAATTAPALLPGYGEPAWVDLDDGSSPRGYQPIVDVSQRLQLPGDRDVLRVVSSQRAYLRLAGLDTFDGSTWRLGAEGESSYTPDPSTLTPATRELPPERPSATTRDVDVDVRVLALENIYVPTPYQPLRVLGPIADEMVWSTDGGFLVTWDTVDAGLDGEARVGVRPGVEYRVRAQQPDPSFDELAAIDFDAVDLDRHTALPREYPELGAQAQQVYDDAGATTVVEQVLALQDWFVGPEGDFTYDLDVAPLRGDDALTEFVLEDRTGYCEYFATAMAVMLRETGIPARVAVGFLPGRVTDSNPRPTEQSGQDWTEYTVSTSDAHAWVEVLFPGAGWITFEPTPRSDNTQILPTADDLAPTQNEAERLREAQESDPSEAQTDDPDDPAEQPPSTDADEAVSDDRTGGGLAARTSGALLWLVAAVVLVVLVVWMTAGRRRSHHRRADPHERVLEAQRGLFATAERYGARRAPNETAVEVVDRWQRERRIDGRGAPVATAAQAAAFGGSVDDELADEVERLVVELEQMLRASAPRGARMLAPARRPVHAVDRAVTDAIDRVERWRRQQGARRPR